MKFSWSIISIISRFFAVAIGLVQSVIIVKLLTVSDYGLVGLVTSIAAIVGVYQNLGISSGSTREIAATKNKDEAFKVFIGSTIVRYIISLPLVLGLFIFAPYLGNIYYHRPEIINPLRIFSLILFIQALQSVLNSVIQGTKQFKFLFIFQSAISIVSLIIYIPFLIGYGFVGYFYALLVFNIISTFILVIYVLKVFFGHLVLPNAKELKSIVASVFKIGLFVYFIKIIFMQWQKLGPVLLGKDLSDEMLGIFSFALLVASKITTISDAVTDVTLPSMTSVFEKSKHEFKDVFLNSNAKAYFLILFSSVFLIIFKFEIFQFVDFVFNFIGKDPITTRYVDAFKLMDPLILAFWAYSHINLLKSGVAVPARKLWGALISYALMFLLTVAIYYAYGFSDSLMWFSVAMGLGGLVAYIVFIFFIKKEVGFYPITKGDIVYTLLSLLLLIGYYLNQSHWILGLVYLAISYVLYKKVYSK